MEESGQKESKNGTEPLLDAEDGIKRIGGDVDLYRMILQEFYNENNAVAGALKEKIDVKDYAGAAEIVHKIKSSLGNIGATRLYNDAAELQKFLGTDDEAEIIKKHEQFQILFQKLMDEINNFQK